MKKKIIQGVLGIIFAALGLYIFYRQMTGGEDGGESILVSLNREISHTNIWVIIACVILTVLPMWLRAIRLKIMLPDVEGANNRHFFSLMMIFFMANNILPMRLGEAARVVMMRRHNNYPLAVSIGSLIVERVIDTVVYLSFLFVPVLLSPKLAHSLRAAGGPVAMTIVWISAASFVLIVFVSLLYAFSPKIFRNLANYFVQKLPHKIRDKVKKIGADIDSCCGWIFSLRKTFVIMLHSYLIAFCFCVMLVILVYDFGAFGFLDSVFAQAFAAFGSTIPLAPGAVGTLHAALLFGLSVCGVSAVRASAVTVLYHALQYIIVTIFGLALFARLQLNISDLTSRNENAP